MTKAVQRRVEPPISEDKKDPMEYESQSISYTYDDQSKLSAHSEDYH